MTTLNNVIYWIVALLIRIICRINGGLEIRGRENVPAEGGVLVAANHISYMDPPLLGAVVPRRATFMARKGLFDVPVIGWMIKSAAFPVDRQRTQPSTIKETVKRLKRGELIALFPEGRRSDTGELLEARRGIGLLVSLSRVPVVPTLIMGSDRALPVDARWMKRAKITVVFGKPLFFSAAAETKGQGGHEAHDEISRSIMEEIRKLREAHGN